MGIKRKYVIEKTTFPLDGIYNYNAQVWISVDGESFCYCGIGRYCRTKKEAREYCKQYESNHKEVKA